MWLIFFSLPLFLFSRIQSQRTATVGGIFVIMKIVSHCASTMMCRRSGPTQMVAEKHRLFYPPPRIHRIPDRTRSLLSQLLRYFDAAGFGAETPPSSGTTRVNRCSFGSSKRKKFTSLKIFMTANLLVTIINCFERDIELSCKVIIVVHLSLVSLNFCSICLPSKYGSS